MEGLKRFGRCSFSTVVLLGSSNTSKKQHSRETISSLRSCSAIQVFAGLKGVAYAHPFCVGVMFLQLSCNNLLRWAARTSSCLSRSDIVVFFSYDVTCFTAIVRTTLQLATLHQPFPQELIFIGGIHITATDVWQTVFPWTLVKRRSITIFPSMPLCCSVFWLDASHCSHNWVVSLRVGIVVTGDITWPHTLHS